MDLWDLSIAQIARAYRNRSLSPVDVVRSLFDRIERLDPVIRAWETLDVERALTAAARCGALLAGDGAGTRPLLGVPFGVKDVIFTAGLRTACGSPLYDSFVPEYDATVVARLKAAGAILMGKTTTTQFAFVDPVPTRNPWDTSRTPGFSSAGSVAAVAARTVPAALGTQTGGSTIRPAAYCGVVGMKPTFGRIGRRGIMPISWSLDDVGLIGREVEDVGILLRAAAGAHRGDPSASRRAVGEYGQLQPAPPRLGWLRGMTAVAQPAVRRHLEDVATRLSAAGAQVRELETSLDIELLFALQQVTLLSEAAAVHAEPLGQHPEGYAPRLRAFVHTGELVPASVYLAAQRLRRRARAEVRKLFRGLDCLMVPSQPDVAPPFGTDVDATLQAPWTLLGLPALTLPSGLTPAGLPLGVQLVAPAYREDRLIAAARWCEAVLGKLPAAPV